MSYLAVFGLIVYQPVVYRWFTFKNKWADRLWAICSVSIAAQVITFPLSAFYFHQFPVYFLISNVFIIIPSAVIMYSGIFYLLLPQIPILSKALAFILEKTILLMDKALAIIEHAPYASINKIWITIPEYLLLYLVIICAFYFLYDKKAWLLKVCLVCTLLLSLSLSYKAIRSSQSDNIAWLDLKKHKGIIFKHGDQAVVLSDLKLTDKAYQYSIQPYLDSCRISHLKLIDFNTDLQAAWFNKKYNMIQYLNKTVFIYDRPLQHITFNNKLKADYIYFSVNYIDEIDNLSSNFNYQLLIIDASNRDNLTGTIIKQAADQHIN